MFGLLAFTALAGFFGLFLVVGLAVLALRLFLGLVLLPFKLAAVTLKLVLGFFVFLVILPLMAIAVPILLAIAALALVFSPFILIVLGIVWALKPKPQVVRA